MTSTMTAYDQQQQQQTTTIGLNTVTGITNDGFGGEPYNANINNVSNQFASALQQQQRNQQQALKNPNDQKKNEMMLHCYIYDFLKKKNLNNSAEIFAQESAVLNELIAKEGKVIVPIDSSQSFLHEWWGVFWDFLNSQNSSSPNGSQPVSNSNPFMQSQGNSNRSGNISSSESHVSVSSSSIASSNGTASFNPKQKRNSSSSAKRKQASTGLPPNKRTASPPNSSANSSNFASSQSSGSDLISFPSNTMSNNNDVMQLKTMGRIPPDSSSFLHNTSPSAAHTGAAQATSSRIPENRQLQQLLLINHLSQFGISVHQFQTMPLQQKQVILMSLHQKLNQLSAQQQQQQQTNAQASILGSAFGSPSSQAISQQQQLQLLMHQQRQSQLQQQSLLNQAKSNTNLLASANNKQTLNVGPNSLNDDLVSSLNLAFAGGSSSFKSNNVLKDQQLYSMLKQQSIMQSALSIGEAQLPTNGSIPNSGSKSIVSTSNEQLYVKNSPNSSNAEGSSVLQPYGEGAESEYLNDFENIEIETKERKKASNEETMKAATAGNSEWNDVESWLDFGDN